MRSSDIAAVLSRLRTRLRTLWFGGLSVARVYRRLTLLARPLDQAGPEIPVPPSMRVAPLAASEVDAYVAFRPDRGAAEIRRRLDQGHECFAVWHEGRIIHAAWAVAGRAHVEYLSRDLELESGEVYIYDAFTAPAFRGRNASPVRALAMGAHFRARRCRSVLTAVRPENTAGFRPLEKVGTEPVGVIGYIGIGPLRWHFSRRRDRGGDRA
jgi:hypothetical protein